MLPGLFRGHVTRRPYDIAGASQTAVGSSIAGEAKVGHLRHAILIQQDVGRFQDRGGSRLFREHTRSHSATIAHESRPLPSGSAIGPLAYFVLQTLSLDRTHREVMLPLVFADFEDRHDAGMV